MSLFKKILIIGIVGLIVFFGFFREFIFENINGQLYIAYYHAKQEAVSEKLKFLWGMSYERLFYLKWVFTILFTIIYFSLSYLLVSLLFREKKFRKYTVWSFGVLCIISFLFMGIGYLWTGAAEKSYEFARYIMGFAQSPVVLMILIPAFKLSAKEIS